MNKNLFIVIFVALFSVFISLNRAMAQPSVTGVSGNLAHKDTITISGAGFGSKSPAAPLMWDDCEDSTVDSDSAVTDSGWVDVWPYTDSTAPTEVARTRYRTAGTFRGVDGPHDKSTKYLAGCHYQESPYNWTNTEADTLAGYPGYNERTCQDGHVEGQGGCSSGVESTYRAVMVTADSGAANVDTWTVFFYYRLDPDWGTDHQDNVNHKWNVFQTGGAAYTGTPATYQSFEGSHSPGNQSGDTCRISQGNNSGCGDNASTINAKNPRLDWVHVEVRVGTGTNNAQRRVFFDATEVFDGGDISSCPDNWLVDTRSFTIGGYYRRATGTRQGNWSYRGGVDNYRYFDDMYVDTTWSRVMLANNADYSLATIVEPQIPSAWGEDAITCQVNLGRLSASGRVYLFVFDADNEHNDQGYPVDVGGESSVVPTPPDSLRVTE